MAALVMSLAPGTAIACDSTGCLLVTRSASGLLAPKTWRLDLSFRTTDDSRLMSGSARTARVNRPKVDFEHGVVRPGFHQDVGGTARFFQVDVGYGLAARTTALLSTPVLTHRSYVIGHPPALTERYETWGIGDTLVSVRRAFVASPGFSLVGGVGLELPTGKHRLVSPEALYDIGVLDPMLQPGSGSFDLVLSVQGSQRLTRGGLEFTGAASYQANTTNDLDYRYGNDAIASLSMAHPIGSRLRASLQVKGAHRGRSEYRADPVPSTGGQVVYAIPGLAATLPGRVSAYLFVPMPVYRYVNEAQVSPRFSLVIGMGRSF